MGKTNNRGRRVKIPFEFAESCWTKLDVLSIFNGCGAHLNFDDRTIVISDNKISGFKETLVMGSVISRYEKFRNKQQGVE